MCEGKIEWVVKTYFRDGKSYITETGAYAAGKKCGHWTQYDATTGMIREWEE